MRHQLIKRYFFAGLLVWVPLAITAWVLSLIVNTMDQSLRLLPSAVHPQNLLGFDIPGAGAAITLGILLLTGMVATNFLGQKLVGFGERILARIPVVSSVYNSVKQVSDTLFSDSGQAFRKALLIEYPRAGCWTIGFQTGTPGHDIQSHVAVRQPGEPLVSVYVPTTPNPTSGFFLMLPESAVIALDMTVDEALKYIISMGVVAPPAKPEHPPLVSHP